MSRSTETPPTEDFEQTEYSDDSDANLDPGILEADPDDVTVARKRDKSAWRRIEQRTETEWLRRELADWDDWDEYAETH